MAENKRIRPMGTIMLELEEILLEMVEEHDLQWGDIFGLIHTYLMVHCPGAREQYDADGSHPEFYYGVKSSEQ